MDLVLGGSIVLLWIIVVANAIATLAIYRYFAAQYLKGREGKLEQGPTVGTTLRIPAQLVDIFGQRVLFPRARPSILAFLSTSCKPCQELSPHLTELTNRFSNEVNLVQFIDGPPDEVRSWAKSSGKHSVIVHDVGHKLSAAWDIIGTPFLVGINEKSLVQNKGIVVGWDGVIKFKEDVSGSPLLITEPIERAAVTT